jgi:hypothetical protein
VATSEDRPNQRVLDAARGRTAAPEELRRHLPSAPSSYLAGALDNPGLAEEEVLLLLRNRGAPAQVLAPIAADRRWTRLYDVKKGLVRHPNMPAAAARTLAAHLYWKDLAETAEDVRVPPAVRRKAEDLLRVRLQEMALGERVALARRASRGVIPALLEDPEAGVLRALLGNPRIVEREIVRIAARPETPPEALGALARHPVWSGRLAVRMAILANPRTPVPDALGLVQRFPRQDLQKLARDGALPRIVQVGAARKLASMRENPLRRNRSG